MSFLIYKWGSSDAPHTGRVNRRLSLNASLRRCVVWDTSEKTYPAAGGQQFTGRRQTKGISRLYTLTTGIHSGLEFCPLVKFSNFLKSSFRDLLRMSKLPGNAGVSVLGDKSLEFYRDPISFCRQRIDKHGSRLFQSRLLNRPTVFICSVRGTRELLCGMCAWFSVWVHWRARSR